MLVVFSPALLRSLKANCALLQAAEFGLWGAARHLFETGLGRFPQHVLLLEKLAEALTLANDWPAAQDCVHQLSKIGMLSKHAKRILEKVSETSAGPAHASAAQYSAGSSKRRRIDLQTVETPAAMPAKITLPTSDWQQLLEAVTSHVLSHLEGSTVSTYTFSLALDAAAASLNGFPDDPQAAQHKLNQQQLMQTVNLDRPEGSRPQSAGEDAAPSQDEPNVQDCAERVSKRIAKRRSVL